MACLAGVPASSVLAFSIRNLTDAGAVDEVISPSLAGQLLLGLPCGSSTLLGPAAADTGASAASGGPFMAMAFDVAVSDAAPRGARARALQAASDPLGLAGVLAGGPMLAPLSSLQRAVLEAIVALSAGLQLPAPNAAGVTPDSAFGGQMRLWLAQLGAPAVDAWAVQLLLNGVAYYNLNGTNMLALRAAVLAAVPTSAPQTSGGAGGSSALVAAIAGGSAAILFAALATAGVRVLLRRRRRAHVAIRKAPRVAIREAPHPSGGKGSGAAPLAHDPLNASNPLHAKGVASNRSVLYTAAPDEGVGDGAMNLALQAAAYVNSRASTSQRRATMSPQPTAAGGMVRTPDLASADSSIFFAERARALVQQASSSSRVGYGVEPVNGSREASAGNDTDIVPAGDAGDSAGLITGGPV